MGLILGGTVIYFTSDTHLGHANIIKYCNRPFDNVQEMDRVIIENWNSVVSQDDWVYHLGDFSMGDPIHYARQLNGRIILLLGNHDHNRLSALYKAFGKENIHELLKIKVEGHTIVLCHYAMRVWHKSHFNSWHLYGHSHGKLQGEGKSFDVGVDSWDYTPISVRDVAAEMNERPDNFNKIRKEYGEYITEPSKSSIN